MTWGRGLGLGAGICVAVGISIGCEGGLLAPGDDGGADASLDGAGARFSCRSTSKCLADPPVDTATCEAELAGPCASQYLAFGDCEVANQACDADGKTDAAKLFQDCRAELDAYLKCKSRGGADASTKPIDAGADTDVDSGEACPGPPLGADPPWNPPPAPQNVCTSDDMAWIRTFSQQQGATFTQLQAQLAARNAACAGCVFSHDTDPTWGPIVWENGGPGAFFDFGACFATATGGSVACGKAVEQFELCADLLCPLDACGSDNAVTQCIQKVAADPTRCGKYGFQAACPNFQHLSSVCSAGLDVIGVLCAGNDT